jgi:hypothetical protein
MIVDELGRIPMSPFLKATLARAAEYAEAQAHREVMLEHLLLALAEDPEASVVLKSSNVDIARLMSDVSGYLGRHDDRVDPAKTAPASAISADLRRILEAAAAAAQQGRRREINGAIVLAAIVGDGKSPSAHMLRAQGMTFEAAIRALQRIASAPAAAPRSAEGAEAQGAPPRAQTADDIAASARERSLGNTEQRTGSAAAVGAGAAQVRVVEPAQPPLAEVKEAVGAAQEARREAHHAQAAPARHDISLDEAVASIRREKASQQGPQASLSPQWQSAHVPSRTPGAEGGEAVPGNGQVAQPYWVPSGAAQAQQQGASQQQGAQRTAAGRAPPPPARGAGTRSPFPIGGAFPPMGAPQQAQPPRHGMPPWSDGTGSPRGMGQHGGQQQPPPGGFDEALARLEARRPPSAGTMAGTARAAPGAPPGAEARAPIEAGQLHETIPRRMRVGIPVTAEVLIARAEVKNLADRLQTGGAVYRHEISVTRAMTVRLRAPEGGFTIETTSPETQWIESILNLPESDAARWRWIITPRVRGKKRLQLIVSARTVDAEGLTAETALPDKVFDVRVSINYARTARLWAGWAVAAAAGGLLARFGENALESARTLAARLMGG